MTFTRRNIGPILALAAAVQAAVILYNAMTGYVALHSVWDFLIRLGLGTLFSAPIALVIVLASLIRQDAAPLPLITPQ